MTLGCCALVGLIRGGLGAVGTQVVANGEMAKLILAPGTTEVQVVRSRTSGRHGKETVVRRVGIWHIDVSETLELRHIHTIGFEGCE